MSPQSSARQPASRHRNYRHPSLRRNTKPAPLGLSQSMHEHIIYPSYSSDPYLLLLFILLVGAISFQIFTGGGPPLRRYPLFVYRSSRHYPVETFAEILPANDPAVPADFSITVSTPRTPGSFPLVVFLGAATGSAACTKDLCRFWIEAGYAVVEISQVQHASLSHGHSSAISDNDYAQCITDTLCRLAKRDAQPFDRINFETIAFAGCGSRSRTAQALAATHSRGTHSTTETISRYALVVQEAHTDNLAKAPDNKASPCGDLAIFVPSEGNEESTFRYSSHPLPDKNSSWHGSAPEIAHTVAMQHLTLGFLDAVVKKEPTAIEWLERDAGRWLEPVGELRRA